MKTDIEKEANRFAGALLMPKDEYVKKWRELDWIQDKHRSDILAKYFSVSVFASINRAKSLKLI